MKKRLLSLLVVATMVSTMFLGCDKKETTKTSGETTKSYEDVKTWQEVSGEKEDVTLSWYIVSGKEDYYQYYWKEMEGLKKIQELLGINIEFQVAQDYSNYLPMMAAQSYPDVITAKNLEQYPGRLTNMFNEGVSVDFQPYIDEGLMPHFKEIIDTYPDIARDLKLDTGEYTFASTLYDINNEDDRTACAKLGLAIRQDWLDELDLEVPTNMEEWYNVLYQFKNYDPNGNGEQDEEPVCMASSGWKYFLPAYGIDDDPSVLPDGTTVVYGFATQAYKEFLAEMNKWNTEGLIYNMFKDTSLEKRQERVINNFAGAWKAEANHFDDADTTSYLTVLKEKAPKVEFAAAPWPATADGKLNCFSDINSFDRDTTVITTNAKKSGHDRAAAYMIDFMLSEEGTDLLSWGIEGVTYEVVNGEKQLMDGMYDLVDFHGAQINKINLYADAITICFPKFGTFSEFVLANKSEGYVEACKVWSQGDTSYKMPAACQLSVDQQNQVDDATQNMKSYITKQRQKYIEGTEPLTTFDQYLEKVNTMGADKYTQIWQECYTNYKNR